MHHMTRIAAALAALAAALLLAPAARAAEPLPITDVSPADGASLPPTPTGGIAWQIATATAPQDANVAITVATNPALGPDGTLPTDNRVDFFFLVPSNPPGLWSNRSDPGPNAWSADVGTYYWQAVATWTDAAGVFHSAASPVERLGIGVTPAPLPGTGTGGGNGAGGGAGSNRTTLAMSSLDATFYVRALIRRQTKRTPAGLHYGCKPLNSRSFRCRPTWRDSRNRYSSTIATFTHTRASGRIVAKATARGVRSSRQCLRRGTVSRCGKTFHWTVTLATRPIPPSGSG
jgi:hypothetical protein